MMSGQGKMDVSLYYCIIVCFFIVLGLTNFVQDSIAAGPGGYALKFADRDGDQDIQYVRLNFSDVLYKKARTTSLWFRTSEKECYLFTYYDPNGSTSNIKWRPRLLIDQQGRIIWKANEEHFVSEGEYSNGEWHHLVIVSGEKRHTIEQETIGQQIYIDGKNVCGGQSPQVIGNNNEALFIGFRGDLAQYGSHFYGGYIDDVAVWETALTEDDVMKLYLGASPTSPEMSGPEGPEPYLKGYWPFVNGSGEIVRDVTGRSKPNSGFLPSDPNEDERIQWVRPMPGFAPEELHFGQVFLPDNCSSDGPEYPDNQTLTLSNTGTTTLISRIEDGGAVLGLPIPFCPNYEGMGNDYSHLHSKCSALSYQGCSPCVADLPEGLASEFSARGIPMNDGKAHCLSLELIGTSLHWNAWYVWDTVSPWAKYYMTHDLWDGFFCIESVTFGDLEPGGSYGIPLGFMEDRWNAETIENTVSGGEYSEYFTIVTNEAEDDPADDYPDRVKQKVEVSHRIRLRVDVLSPSELVHIAPEEQDGEVHVAFGDVAEFKVEYTRCYEGEEIYGLQYLLDDGDWKSAAIKRKEEIRDENDEHIGDYLYFDIPFTGDNRVAEPDGSITRNLKVRIINHLGCPTVPDEGTDIRVWERPGKPQAVHDPDNVDWYDSGQYFFGERGKEVRLRAEVLQDELNTHTITEYEWEMVKIDHKDEVVEQKPLFTAVSGSVKALAFDDNVIISADGNIWLRCTAISNYGIKSEPNYFRLKLYEPLQVDAGGPYKGTPGVDVELQAAIADVDEYGRGLKQEYQWKVSDEPGLKLSDGVSVEIYNFPVSPATTQMTIAFWMKSSDQAATLADWKYGASSLFKMSISGDDVKIELGDQSQTISGLSVNDDLWHHIAATWQASERKLKIYKDGEYVTDADLTPLQGAQEGVSQLIIGGDYDGCLDDLSIWNSVLGNDDGKDEIAKLMQGKLSTQEGLVGDWKFDDGEGTIAKDHSDLGNDAVIVGDASAAWPGRTDISTTGGGSASYQWHGRDAVYVVECQADGTTVEGLELTTGVALTTVKIQGGYPIARIGGPYQGGVAGGDFSPVQFEGNQPFQKDLDTEGNEVQVDTWIWRFSKTLGHNQGLRFDGDNYVAVNSLDYSAIQNGLSLSAWFKTGNEGAIVEQALGASDGYSLRVDGGNLVFEFGNGTGIFSASTAQLQDERGFRVNDDIWHHAAGVYDGSEVRLYVDGLLRARASAGGSVAPGSNPLRIGEGFSGFIDEVTVWSKPIAKWHIDALRGGRMPADRSGLLGYWPFSEGIGIVTGNHAVENGTDALVGYPQWVEPKIITVEDQWNPTQEYERPGQYPVTLQVGVGKESGKIRWSSIEETKVTVIDGSISGSIRAADLRTPVSGVRLTLTSPSVLYGDLSDLARDSNDLTADGGGGVYTLTDVEGTYTFQDLPLGTYLIVPSKEDDGLIHRFEKPKESVSLDRLAPDRPAVDFVDRSVFPVGGLIRADNYDLDTDADILIAGVVVEATPLGTTSSIRSTPSESTATATDRNYAIPLHAGEYVFSAEMGDRDIRLDLNHLDAADIPYELVDSDNPNAGAIINIKGATSDICFRDYTIRTLEVFVEDSGGFPIMSLDGEPIGAKATLSGVGVSAEKTVVEKQENGETVAAITYELPPGVYTLEVGQGFQVREISFRNPNDPDDLRTKLDVDLTGSDAQVDMVVPVPIELEFCCPRPSLFGGPITSEFEAFLKEQCGLNDDQINQLKELEEGYMFYWPADPQRHTYALRATANGRPVEGYTLYVTDEISMMTDDSPTEQRIPIPFLFMVTEDVVDYTNELSDSVGGKLPVSESKIKELFWSERGVSLSDDTLVSDASGAVSGWTITDLKAEEKVTYFLRVEDNALCVDQGSYTVLGGLPGMNPETMQGESKNVKFRATKKDYLSSNVLSDDVRVLGDRAMGVPELIAIPNINYLVLHDPPGDCSYSFIDDSLTIKGVISDMTLHTEDGTSIPVYPSAWGRGEGTRIIGAESFDDVSVDAFGRAAALEGYYGAWSAGLAMAAGPVGYAFQFIRWGIYAGRMDEEAGPWGEDPAIIFPSPQEPAVIPIGGIPMVQYSISANRKLETMPTEEMLDVELPDQVGPGRGDVYFGEGWTIGIQPQWRLGVKYEDNEWKLCVDEDTVTYEILDRANQYIYTARDIEKLIERLDQAEEARDSQEEKDQIKDSRDKWIRLLKQNPAYVWSEFYVGYDDNERLELEGMSQRSGLQKFRYDMLSTAISYIGEHNVMPDGKVDPEADLFTYFREAYEHGNDNSIGHKWDMPQDDTRGVETLIFNGGTSFEYSRTISEALVTSFSTEASISTSADTGGELHSGWQAPNPLGASPVKLENTWKNGATLSFTTNQIIRRDLESGTEGEQKVGFILQDDDVGDSITTRVYEDPIYGTPLFIHDLGSVTSDPWEPGTNKGIDIKMEAIPSELDLRPELSEEFDPLVPMNMERLENAAAKLDSGSLPESLKQKFVDNGIPIDQIGAETDAAGSRWYIKVPQAAGDRDYAVRREVDADGMEWLNVYEPVEDDGPFDYQSGAHYKVKLVYTGKRDLESDFTTFDFMLYAPQTDNRDNLTVRFNDQNGTYETYKVGLTKEAPAATISVSVYPPEADQGNWYEKGYSAVILAQEVKDAQINSSITLGPRFKDLGAPQAVITSPYQGQRLGPAIFGDTDEDAFKIEILSADKDIKEIRIESRSRAQNGLWGEWSLLKSDNGSRVKWVEGDASYPVDGNPIYNRYTFTWTGSDIYGLGVGEYQLRALVNDKAGNTNEYPDPPTVDFTVDASSPEVLTTIPDYQARESERIFIGELSVTFTDDMLARYFTNQTFYVEDLLDRKSPHKVGFVSYSPALRKVVFVPEVPLKPNGFYRVTIKADDEDEGIEGVRDLAGNPLKRDFSWTFRTKGDPYRTEPEWSLTLRVESADSGGNVMVDASNIAGVEHGALDGEDEKDARAVPALEKQLRLSFLNRDKEEFDRDIRPADGRMSHHWFFVIGNAVEGSTVNIWFRPSIDLVSGDRQYQFIELVEFDASGNVSNEIWLDPTNVGGIDPQTGEPTEIKTPYKYTCQGEAARYFRLDVQKATALVATTFQTGSTQWKFFSVPIKPVPEDPFVNLGDDIDPFQMYRYDTETGGYKVYPLDLGEVALQTGHGYFTRLIYDVEVEVGGLRNMLDVTLPVLEAEGWHAIGNPFPKEVDVATLKVNGHWFGTSSANMLVENTLYRWKTDSAGDMYEAVDQYSQLLPWEGYWIKTKQDDVTLTIPAPSGLDDAYNILPDSYKPPVMAPPAGDSRRIAVQTGEFDLRLELTSNSSADTTTTLGARQKARIDWDPMDQSEPPILGETVAAYFHHPDWGDDSGLYNRDYQTVLSVGDERTWSVTVYTDKPDSQMKLSWEESISQVPDGVMLYFRRADTAVDDDWQDMRKVRSIDLESRLQFTSIPIEIRAQRYEMRPPSGVQVTPGEKLVILRWEPDDNEFIEGYIITRQNGSAEDWRDGEGVGYSILKTKGDNVSEFVDREVLEEVTYTYQLRVRFMSGAELGSQLFTVRTLPIIKQTALMRCYPNPFNPEVWIPYDLAEEASVSVEIYSASGQLVRTLDLGVQQRGRYASRDKAAHWDGLTQAGEKSASGVYFYVLKAGKYSASKKMVLIR